MQSENDASIYEFTHKAKPAFEWKREVDCFRAGDQHGAALVMVNLIAANLDHSEALDWELELRELLNPTEEGAVAGQPGAAAAEGTAASSDSTASAP